MSLFESIQMPRLYGGADPSVEGNQVEQNKDAIEEASKTADENTAAIAKLKESMGSSNTLNTIFNADNIVDIFIIIFYIVLIFLISQYYDFKFNKMTKNLCITVIWFALIVFAVGKGSSLLTTIYRDLEYAKK